MRKDSEPAPLGRALVQARDLFEVCHANATAGSTDNWEMSPHDLREIMQGRFFDEEGAETEELEMDEVLDTESGEEEMLDEDDIYFGMDFDEEEEAGSSDV